VKPIADLYRSANLTYQKRSIGSVASSAGVSTEAPMAERQRALPP
jgi:hypothetical protein